ncbi:MAG: hypothetical protein F6K16_09420 [Symploca sp. SIO2B6]|nr:hypothetical protein [Symploca sp. SIO2B6]
MPTETNQSLTQSALSYLYQLANLIQTIPAKAWDLLFSRTTESNVDGQITLDSFMSAMEKKYKGDFIDKVTRDPFQINQQKADEYFRTFVTALYNNRVEGIGPGYGHFYEGGAEGEKGRQNLVDAFHHEVSGFFKEFAPVQALGSTLLWSDAKIGRFSADSQEIIKSAGVTDENAQTLNQTKLGKLWDQLKITTESDEKIGYIWDHQYNVWTSASKEFAANAEGEVHVFLPKNIGAYTVFWNVELPELRQRMEGFTDDPKVTNITIHHLTDDALQRARGAGDNEEDRRQVLLDSNSWENLDFSQASLDVPKFSDKQNKLLQDSNPLLLAKMDNYVSTNKTAGTITISKLNEIAQRWRDKAKQSASAGIELSRKIADKYGHINSVPWDILDKIRQSKATSNELTQYADKLVQAFQNGLSEKQPENYNDSDIEIITRLLHENYTRLQQPSIADKFTKVISKTEIENLLTKRSGDPSLDGFSNFNQYSQRFSAQEAIEQFGLDYQYQNGSGQTIKPYLISEGEEDKTLPFVYYVTTPITDDLKKNTKIPLDPEVKKKLQDIVDDTTRDENDELKKMAQELIADGVYHELTPNTGDDLPKYGTQTDGKKSYAGMLRTTYSTSRAQLSTGAMIRAKGPNGEDFKIADWDGLTWTLSPQSSKDFPDWLTNQGRTEDRLNFNEELKVWKRVGDDQIVPPSNIPAPVRAFMEHHFQTSFADLTIQKVNSTDNDDSTSTVIKFKPGEYDDTTVDGLKKIAEKLDAAVKLKFTNNGNQPDVSKPLTQINDELPTKSVSIKNDLMKLRQPRTSFADTVNAAVKFLPKFNTIKTRPRKSAKK